MYISELTKLLNNICLALLAVSPTVFVFGVTLLGAAVERSEQEEKSARENEAEKIQEEIKKVEGSISAVKRGGTTTDLTIQLKELINNKNSAEEKIKLIKVKYSRINLNNTVIYPCLAFIFSILISSSVLFLKDWVSALLMGIELALIFFGLVKLYLSLSLIQEISANKKESEHFNRLKEAFKSGFAEYEQAKTEEAVLYFPDKKFPLNISASTELRIDFLTDLKKGKHLTNVSVWFFVPDGFELIKPAETASWRQSSDYSLPNIRTVKIDSGTLNTGTRNRGHIIFKTPSTIGKYAVRYQICADGYNGENHDLKIIVN